MQWVAGIIHGTQNKWLTFKINFVLQTRFARPGQLNLLGLVAVTNTAAKHGDVLDIRIYKDKRLAILRSILSERKLPDKGVEGMFERDTPLDMKGSTN